MRLTMGFIPIELSYLFYHCAIWSLTDISFIGEGTVNGLKPIGIEHVDSEKNPENSATRLTMGFIPIEISYTQPPCFSALILNAPH